MIDRAIEYQRMFEVEETHWWYRTLHELVLENIQSIFTTRELRILDAGCGTGGCLRYLARQQYVNLQGFDVSQYALDICNANGLNVFSSDLRDFNKYIAPTTLDVIICNDVFYFLDTTERQNVLSAFWESLRPEGLLLMNVPAIQAFHGMHDRAVGIHRRFCHNDMKRIFKTSDFVIKKMIYWPFLLSPIIWGTRTLQRMQMRLFPSIQIESDVNLPAHWLNALLYNLVRFENRTMSNKPWGSSLFVVAQKAKIE